MASFETYYQQLNNERHAGLDQNVAQTNANYQQQEKEVQDNYQGKIADSNQSFFNADRKAAVQKLVHQNIAEERMANLGLQNSGVSRVGQQANESAFLKQTQSNGQNRQRAVDALIREMNNHVGTLESSRQQAEAKLRKDYDSTLQRDATALAKADLAAEQSRAKAAAAAQKKASSAKKSTSSLARGLPQSVAKTVLSKISNESFGDAVNLLDTFGASLSAEDVSYWKNLLPRGYWKSSDPGSGTTSRGVIASAGAPLARPKQKLYDDFHSFLSKLRNKPIHEP